MSLHHAASGEVIQIHPPGSMSPDAPSVALLKSARLEVMRLVLPKGKSVPEHHVAGEITLQCLEGTVEVQAHEKTQSLQVGQMLHLLGNVPYALYALENSSLLMTMLRDEDDAPNS